MNYTVMAWWYYALNLVSGEAEYISDQYNIYTHQEMAWNDTIFEISGEYNDHQIAFQCPPEVQFMNYMYQVIIWWCQPLLLVSGEPQYTLSQYNIYTH
jgi:hypothetical protein